MLLPVKRGWKQHEGGGPCGAPRHREGGTQGSIVTSKSSALPISVAATNRKTIAHALATSPHDVAAGPSSWKGEKRSATTAASHPPLTTTRAAQKSRPKLTARQTIAAPSRRLCEAFHSPKWAQGAIFPTIE